ncbi:MAG: DedA family protein [Actinocatenispora sp.]
MTTVLQSLVQLQGWAVYCTVAALVFGETALLLGIVIPGEAAAILGGVIASRGHVSPVLMCVVVFAAAVVGDSTGFLWGARLRGAAGRGQSRRLRQGVERARRLMRCYHRRAILIGRFIPIVRTAMPDAAGAAQVPYTRFLVLSAMAAAGWASGCVLVGYVAGSFAVKVGDLVGLGVLVAACLVAGWLWHRRRTRRVRR